MNFFFYQEIRPHGSLGYKTQNEYDKELSGGRRSRKETIGGIAIVKK